jgi:hypothetical protein
MPQDEGQAQRLAGRSQYDCILQYFGNCSPHSVGARTREAIFSFAGQKVLDVNPRDIAKPS